MAPGFIEKRIRAFKYAFSGAWILFKTEASIQVQLVIGLLVTLAGFYVGLSTLEWVAQTLAIGLVLAIEGLNSALEELADFVQPEKHPAIGRLKDMAAGAVLFAAFAAIVTGCLIYIPKF